MNITPEKLRKTVDVLRSFGARRVLLFGSYAMNPELAKDIDLAVEGIPLRRILHADVAIEEVLGVPFDLIAREETPEFYDIISKRARVLYEQSGIDR
jgi:predicted nucleotidyltransferase